MKSRNGSASLRRRFMRQKSLLPGSISWAFGSVAQDIWYVAESMIRRWSFFNDHEQSEVNFDASQSSSSGFDGRSPRKPKLSGVATRPSPKWPCQTRLTRTRAVSGLEGLA